jgi:hypothetical protein
MSVTSIPAAAPFDASPQKVQQVHDDLLGYRLTKEDIEKVASFAHCHEKSACGYIKNDDSGLVVSLWFLPPHMLEPTDRTSKPGLYLLLNSAYKAASVAKGGICHITFAYHWESGKFTIFRSLLGKYATAHEIALNLMLASHPEYFNTGRMMMYESTYSSRHLSPDQLAEFKKTTKPLAKRLSKMGSINPHCRGGSLYSHLYRIQLQLYQLPFLPKQKIKMALHIAKGLKILHNLGYVHFDLHPKNILIDKDWIPKICDFGSSCPDGTWMLVDGTKGTTSPQVLKNRLLEEGWVVTTKEDIWSFGCCLSMLYDNFSWYNWAMRQHSYGMTKEDQVVDKIKCIFGRAEFPNPLIMQCLQFSPKDRPDIDPIIAALQSEHDKLLLLQET